MMICGYFRLFVRSWIKAAFLAIPLGCIGHPAQASSLFTEDFQDPDSPSWFVLNRPAPSFMGVDWSRDHAAVTGDGNRHLTLKLDREGARNGKKYMSGSYQSRRSFGGNMLASARIKPAKGAGLVAAMFLYAKNDDGQGHHGEIDIEFLGKDTTKVQFNYYAEGKGGHEMLVDLGFDASEAFHTYGFGMTEQEIRWFVDGELRRTARIDGPLDAGQLIFSLWTPASGHPGLTKWAGGEFGGESASASFDDVRVSSPKIISVASSPHSSGARVSPVPLPPAFLLFGSMLPFLFGRVLWRWGRCSA